MSIIENIYSKETIKTLNVFSIKNTDFIIIIEKANGEIIENYVGMKQGEDFFIVGRINDKQVFPKYKKGFSSLNKDELPENLFSFHSNSDELPENLEDLNINDIYSIISEFSEGYIINEIFDIHHTLIATKKTKYK